MDELEERCFQLKRRIEFLKKRIAVAGGVQKTSDNARPVQWVETETLQEKKNQNSPTRRVSSSISSRDRTQRTTTQTESRRRESGDNSNEDAAREKAVNRLLLAIEAAGVKD